MQEDAAARARQLIDRGATAEALATLESAADRAAAEDPAHAAALLVEAVSVALRVSGPDRAVSIAQRAVAVAAPGTEVASGAELAAGAARARRIEWQRAMNRLGDALSWAGRYMDARNAWLIASANDVAGEDPSMLAERANALLRLGDPSAHDAAFRALVAARQAGDREQIVDAMNLVTVAEVRAGRLREALGTAEQGLAEVDDSGTMDELDALGLLAWVLALLGDVERLDEVIARTGRGLEARRLTAPGGLARGLLALSLGRADEAAQAFEAKLAEMRVGHAAALTVLRPFSAELVEAYARSGRTDDARRALAASLPVALGSEQPRLIAPMRRAQGILEDDADAFLASLDAHAGWDNPFELARTRLAFGEHLRRHRRRSDAKIELQAAAAAFDHVQSLLWRDRALAELRLSGERLPQPARARGAVETLTRQEGEILDLVRAGLSNRDIAERLVLSVKTVEGHLTTIYGKLGVVSRSQALAAMTSAENGLPRARGERAIS